MLNLGLVTLVLLIVALVLFIIGCFMAPRDRLWIAALICAVVALLLRVFGGGV